MSIDQINTKLAAVSATPQMFWGGELRFIDASDAAAVNSAVNDVVPSLLWIQDGNDCFAVDDVTGSADYSLTFSDTALDAEAVSSDGEWFAQAFPLVSVIAVQEDEKNLFLVRKGDEDAGVWMLHERAGTRKVATSIDHFIEQLAEVTPVSKGECFRYNDDLSPLHNLGRLFASSPGHGFYSEGSLMLTLPCYGGEDLDDLSSYTCAGFLDDYPSELHELDDGMPYCDASGNTIGHLSLDHTSGGHNLPAQFPGTIFLGAAPSYIYMYLVKIDEPNMPVYSIDAEDNYGLIMRQRAATLKDFIDGLTPISSEEYEALEEQGFE